ncbi:MAG: hypothetical protein V4544_04665 [Pseudomonadota bacterium]
MEETKNNEEITILMARLNTQRFAEPLDDSAKKKNDVKNRRTQPDPKADSMFIDGIYAAGL